MLMIGIHQYDNKDENTKDNFLLSWLLLPQALLWLSGRIQKIIAILLFTIITVMAVFSFLV